MHTGIKRVSTLGMSREDWLKYRLNGIGASEVGAVMGLNKYEASITLFQKKIGQGGVNVLRKIFGIILLAIAIKLFRSSLGF